MCYVMLGRSERLQDIFIICKDEEMDMQAIRCDPSALAESERLENIFDLAEQQTKSIRNTHWKISFPGFERKLTSKLSWGKFHILGGLVTKDSTRPGVIGISYPARSPRRVSLEFPTRPGHQAG